MSDRKRERPPAPLHLAGLAHRKNKGQNHDVVARPGAIDPELGRAAKLVHDVNGSLAAISLHLQMVSEADLSRLVREHLESALGGVQLVRQQLVEFAQLVHDLRASKPRRTSRRK